MTGSKEVSADGCHKLHTAIQNQSTKLCSLAMHGGSFYCLLMPNKIWLTCVFFCLIYSLTLLRAIRLDLLVSDVSIKFKFKNFHKSIFSICLNLNFIASKIKFLKKLPVALNIALNVLFNMQSLNAGRWKHWQVMWWLRLHSYIFNPDQYFHS